jgi:hypothetical protein
LNELYEVIGSNNSDEFLNHLTTTNSKDVFLNLEVNTVDTTMKFDGIYSNKVMHHLLFFLER